MARVALIASVVLGAAGQLLFKAGLREAATLPAAVGPPVLLGLACYGLSTVFWLYALQRQPLGQTYAFLSLNFVLVPLAAHYVLGEPLSAGVVLGAVLIIGGILATLLL